MKDVEAKIKRWKEYKELDIDLKMELNEMSSDELYEAFYKDLEFGTGGVREKLGVGSSRLNIYTIRKLTEGYAHYILSKTKKTSIVVAYDNRKNSYQFALEVARIMSKYEIITYVFETLRPTPELSFAVRELHAFGGIVITASHNPKEYNGFKLYDANGCQVTLDVANSVLEEINKVEDELNIPVADEETFNKYTKFIGKELDEKYYERLREVEVNKNLSKDDLKIVFTPQHGTSNIPVRTMLDRLGYHVIPVKEQLFPDISFINTKSPNPENKEAFILAEKYAKENKADLIISTDPDCDRLGVGILDHGEYVYLTGNQTGAILLEYILENKKNKNLLHDNMIVFNTIVTSDLGSGVAKNYHAQVYQTLTGFKFIGEQIELQKEKEFVFGYEESYGYLIKDFVRDKDAVQSTILLCEVVNYYKKQGLTLKNVLDNLYQKYGYFYDKLDSYYFEGVDGLDKIKRIMDYFRSNKVSLLSNHTIVSVDDYLISKRTKDNQEEKLLLPKSNVLKFYFDDNSWLAIRPSGTEPKCKFYYCIKDKNQELAEKKYFEMKENIDKYINEL